MYFAGIFFLGFLLGTIRTLALVPIMGQLAAVLVELPFMLTASWFACARILKHYATIREHRQLIIMGGSAFVWLMGTEIVLSVALFGQPLAEFAANLLSTHGIVGLAGQLAFGCIPLVYSAVTKARIQ